MAVSPEIRRGFYLLSFCFCLFNLLVSGANAEDNPYRHIETLNRAGTYNLEWVVDWHAKRVIFNVTVATKGYVGFGIGRFRKGTLIESDFIIGGVKPDGKSYFADYHGHHTVDFQPKRDESQDWTLISAWEHKGKTSLQFSRAIDTCDEDDLPITDDLTKLIWAYSEVDDIAQYHHQVRGIFDAYLLDPDLTPRSTSAIKNGTSTTDIKVFSLRKEIVLRNQDTQYWCTFHKVPLTQKKRHIVGFNVTFPDDRHRRHVHHILLHRCRAPPGMTQEEFLGPATRTGGSECYILDTPNPLPVPYCREVIYIWAVNSRPIFLPEHAGILLDTNLGQDEYLMFQAHYDNPNSIVQHISMDLDVYYTEKMREHDVGTLQLGNLQPGATTILIPPNDLDHVVLGQCAPGCTKRMFPKEGINIFAGLLHTHISGIGVRQLHLRNGKELPWIAYDDNYNFNFQQFRIFREEVKVLPGDQIINRCQYSSPERNGTTLHGGFSTRQEMCTAFMYYYTHSPGFALCRSEIRTREYNEGLLGVGNMTWVQSLRQMVITSPPKLAGTTIGDHVNNNINWTLDMRKRLQHEQLYQPQISQCPRFHYKDHSTQLRAQLDSGILERTGRLPGSDGKLYTSVDEDFEHEARYPMKGPRYERPPRCTRKHPAHPRH